MKVFRTISILLVTAIVLASCTGSFAYNRLDWLIPWYVDGYVDLSSEQRQSLRDQLVPLLQWHRQDELVRYQEFLHEIEAELQNPVNEGQVESWIEEFSQAATRIEQTMLQVAVDFGATVSDQQIQEFLESLYSRQSELEEELLSRSDEAYTREHTVHLKDLMQKFLGRLDHSQKLRLEQGARAMQRYDTVWLNDRSLWLDQLTVLLQRKNGWQTRLTQAYQDRESSRPEEYSKIVEHNKKVITAAVTDVLNSRNDKQKVHTKREFSDVDSMLQKLIDQTPGKP